MMLYPPISGLLEKVDSRYTLVVLASKRARQLNDELKNEPSINVVDEKTVTRAINEIFDGTITYSRKDSI